MGESAPGQAPGLGAWPGAHHCAQEHVMLIDVTPCPTTPWYACGHPGWIFLGDVSVCASCSLSSPPGSDMLRLAGVEGATDV